MGIQSWDDVHQYSGEEDLPSWKEYDDKVKRLDTIEDYIQGVLGEIYGDHQLNIERLEWYLEEMAHQVGVRIPNKDIRLKRMEQMAHSANVGE